MQKNLRSVSALRMVSLAVLFLPLALHAAIADDNAAEDGPSIARVTSVDTSVSKDGPRVAATSAAPVFTVEKSLSATAFDPIYTGAPPNKLVTKLSELFAFGTGDAVAPLQLRASEVSAQTPRSPMVIKPLSVFAAPANGLSQNEAVRMAVNQHPSIAAAMSLLSQQGSLADAARAAYYPQISGGLNNGLFKNYGATGDQSKALMATLKASQVLFDFGKIGSRVSQAEHQGRKQMAQVLKQVDTIATQTSDAVVVVHRQQELTKIASDQVAALGQVLEIAHLRATAGLSTQSDPVQALTRLEAAKANHVQMATQLQLARDRLRTYIGASLNGEVADMAPQLLLDVPLNASVDFASLPDMLLAESDRAVAAALLESTKAEGMPTFSLEANFNKALTGINPTTLESRGRDYSAGIAVSNNIYQGGANASQVKAAAFAVEAAQMNVDAIRLNTQDQLRSFREQVEGAQRRIAVLTKRTQSILRTRQLYQEQYKLGSRSVLDLLNAELELHQSRSEEITVRHDVWQNLVAYIGAAGLSRRVYGLNNTSIQGVELLP